MPRGAVPAAALAALAWLGLAACAGPPAPVRSGGGPATVDRCVIALRFVSDEDVVAERSTEESPTEEEVPVPPTTELSLVRICDRSGRTLASLGAQTGVCQYVAAPPVTLIAARCWWPGREAVALRVVRDAGAVTAFAVEADGEGEARELGSVELPDRARIDVLAPGRQRAEP